MIKIWNCRRSMLAVIGMGLMALIAFINKVDTSGAIATVVMAIAASNAAQAIGEKKKKED